MVARTINAEIGYCNFGPRVRLTWPNGFLITDLYGVFVKRGEEEKPVLIEGPTTGLGEIARDLRTAGLPEPETVLARINQALSSPDSTLGNNGSKPCQSNGRCQHCHRICCGIVKEGDRYTVLGLRLYLN